MRLIRNPRRRRPRAVLALAVVLLLTLAGVASAAITPAPNNAAGATTIANAITATPGILTGASYANAVAGPANGTADAPISFFPTQGSTFGILTSGSVAAADDPNNSPSTSTNNGTSNVRGNTDRDVSILKLDLNVPQGANCVSFNFAFYSEEFPEYVGSAFNDAFIAEMDNSSWTTSGSTISAPNNFAFDPGGQVISINSTGATAMNAANAAGTTYDGATTLLSAATQVTPGAHSLYLSIFDQGDFILDSAVFLDNLRAGFVPNPSVNCAPGATPVNFLLSLDPASDTNPVGTPHTVTATVTDDEGNEVAGAPIGFTVTGANPTTGSGTTNAAGQATFTYTGANPGNDTIAATYMVDGSLAASASATKTWIANADLRLAKGDAPDPVLLGQNLTYALTATNDGPTAANGVSLSDTLPAGVTFVSATPSQGSCTPGPGTVNCALGNLANGASATVSIVVTPNAPGTIVNNASVTSATPDPNPGNNAAQASTLVRASTDLAITKTASPGTVLATQNITYALTARNNGPSPATGVRVTDVLPAGVSFVSASPSQGTCSQASGTVTCQLGNLASGATANIGIVGRAQTKGTKVNTASITGNETDPVAANNSASATTTVLIAQGSAFGARVQALLVRLGPLPSVSRSTPGTSSATLANVNAIGLLRAQGLAVNTTIGPEIRVDSSAQIAHADLLGVVAVVDGLRASCSATPQGSSGATTIARLVVAGQTFTNYQPPPNTTIAVPGVASLVLNEQVAVPDGIQVNALHVRLLGGAGDIILSQAVCIMDP